MATFAKIAQLSSFYNQEADISMLCPVLTREESAAVASYEATVNKVIQGWIPFRAASPTGALPPTRAYVFSLALSESNTASAVEHPHMIFYRNPLGELEVALMCSAATNMIDLSSIATSASSTDSWVHLRDQVDLSDLPSSRARELREQWANSTWLIPSTSLASECRVTSVHVSSQYTKSCDHLHVLMKSLMAHFNEDSFEALLPALEARVNEEFELITHAVVETGPAYVDPTVEILNRYAFRKSILIEGDQGSGKTVAARAFANSSTYVYLELGGNAGVTDMDLVGYNYPTFNDNKPIWIDGVLSTAMRQAAKGEKVVLVMDEFLRIPADYLKVFLNMLSPFNIKGQDVYRLNTGRVLSVDENGLGSVELLTAPCENLCIIATTNVGAQFNVEDMDPALRERFIVVRKDTTEPFLRMVCGNLLAKKPFQSPELLDRLLAFFSLMTRAFDDKKLRNKPSTRILSDAILFAETEDDVYKHLHNSTLQWTANSHNGMPNQDQIEVVHAAISNAQHSDLSQLLNAGTQLV